MTTEIKSSWESTKQRSTYHFDNTKFDPEVDKVIHLGQFEPTWGDELEKIIAASKTVTWRTRGKTGKERPEDELAAEDYDLERTGYGKDYEISNLNWELPPVLDRLVKRFALEDSQARLHVQLPGQLWNLHLDKLEKWDREHPENVIRIQVQLTDWQPGHFWSYGNYLHSMWRAGDVTTFDWQNIPHSTANAGHHPRVTLQITGVMTDASRAFLRSLGSKSPYRVD
jgi:hypothetical protein